MNRPNQLGYPDGNDFIGKTDIYMLRGEFLQKHNRFIQAIQSPPETWLGKPDCRSNECWCLNCLDLGTTWPLGRTFLAKSLLPAPSVRMELRTVTKLRLAIIALACERYRIRHGTWPASVEELAATRFLKAVPADPFSGLSFRFAKTQWGMIVYSVGEDRVDDGGRLDWSTDARTVDIGFRLFETSARNLPVEILPAPRSGEE